MIALDAGLTNHHPAVVAFDIIETLFSLESPRGRGLGLSVFRRTCWKPGLLSFCLTHLRLIVSGNIWPEWNRAWISI